MSDKWENIGIALGGIFQAATLVDQLARTGYVSTDHYRCSIESLFQFDPPSTRDVYGNNLSNLNLGLSALRDALVQGNRVQPEPLRYSLGILFLQKKLSGRKDMMGVIGSRLQQAAKQAEHFGNSLHDNVIGNIGDLYGETISTFRFRIQVTGDSGYLQQPRIAAQVRALLLTGIRAAILWRQVGGNRWQLVFGRKRILAAVEKLLAEAGKPDGPR